MDDNHQDKTESKLTATKDKLHPLSSRDQKGPDDPQSNRMRRIIKRLGVFGYDKETKEYAPNGQLAKITKEYQPGKTFWDWLQLLIIPLVLAGGGYLFATWQHDTDQHRTLDQQQATILQTYIDNIQDLLLNHHLLKSKPNDDAAILARARTLTALQGLDPERKGDLVQFIYDAGLIGFMSANNYPSDLYIERLQLGEKVFCTKCKLLKESEHNSIIRLDKANLSGADLANANLKGADLIGANLANAKLSYADLGSANLELSFLRSANLKGAYLNGADLRSAYLKGADLTDADLSGANLDVLNFGPVTEITQEQLDQVYSCEGAILPMGLRCHPNNGP